MSGQVQPFPMTRPTEYIASLLSIASIALITAEYIYTLTGQQLIILYTIDLAIVIVLAADFIKRVIEGGRRYLLRNSYEILALIPALLFALLEQSTLLGAATRGLRLLRLLRIISFSSRGLRTLRMLSTFSRHAHLGYLLAVSTIVVLVGTFSAYLLESDLPDARIRDLGDAFWWALATVTTVGYGDVVPVTFIGRAVGVALMISGIAILSVFISSLGAFLFSRIISAGPKTITDEVKEAIKKKVEVVESLSDEEVRR